MAVKSIKLVVPPGYFSQRLYSWYEKWAGCSRSIHVLWAQHPQMSPHSPKMQRVTYAVERHLHLNHNRSSRDYLVLLLLYGLYSMNLWILQRELVIIFAEKLDISVLEYTSQRRIVPMQMRRCKGAENELIHWAGVLILQSYNSFLSVPASPFCAAKQLNVLRSHGQHGRATSKGEAKLISLFNCSQKLPP